MGLFLILLGISLIVFIGLLISDHLDNISSTIVEKIIVLILLFVLAFIISGLISLFASANATELQSCEQITLAEIDNSPLDHYYFEVGEDTIYYAFVDERGATKVGTCPVGRAEISYVNDTPTLFIETYGLGEKGLKWFWNIITLTDYCFYIPGPDSIDTSRIVDDLIR